MAVKESKEISYTKDQFLSSIRFTGVEKDIMSVVLDADGKFTEEQVTVAIQNFMNEGAK
ncbi:hypothetical protein [Paenibacillus guangzhouensis]|uniref:hypothetical protein n=1 Tax=Paenibacillus guangzhouensis TaxID=1473112 RepID=UPI00187B1595|nr:hypothetical protein [Paenibacillus guangzhouensis]